MGNGESREGDASKADQNGESEEETSRSNSLGKALAVAGAVAAGAALLYQASGSSTQNDKEEEVPKMMKPPGRKGYVLHESSFSSSSPDGRSKMKEMAEGFHTRPMIKILTYNVWPREDIEVEKRMKALGDLILLHSPDVVCFQEVTPYIYELFENSTWWDMYKCSLTRNMVDDRQYFCMQMSKFTKTSFKCKQFTNSKLRKELLIAEIDLQPNRKLTVATTHLKSPVTWNQMYSKERVAQAKESIEILKIYPNVVFGGDMNWNDELDGDFPLVNGWIDAWNELRRGENGWTYDTVSNKMLTGGRTFQTRLDRFVCCLNDFRVVRIKMIGKDAIPGASYIKEMKVTDSTEYEYKLPVLPSDHYGLLLTVQSV